VTVARLAHTLTGDPRAPVLVLGSSLGTTMAMWEPQVHALGAHLQVLCFEPRGHGGSEVTPGPYSIAELGGDLMAVVDSLGIERMSYCGLSLGAMIGMWFAANAPERVDRLALCCTSAKLGTPAMWSERAQRVRLSGTAGEVQASIERWFTAGLREREPDTVARAAAWLRATAAEGYAGCCEAIGAMDLRPALARITAPPWWSRAPRTRPHRPSTPRPSWRESPRRRCALSPALRTWPTSSSQRQSRGCLSTTSSFEQESRHGH
jgi:3-oxoadipate enol-lactonase